MKKDLLVCIAFHYNRSKLVYLQQVLNEFNNYKCELDIIIDTNTDDLAYSKTYFGDSLKIYKHYLPHPFNLTQMHRTQMKQRINDYDTFMYIEDDILLPYEKYLNYLGNFKILFPKYVPSFVRIEQYNGNEYITDATEEQRLEIIEVGGKQFCELKNSYHGFWIMPQKELKETMIEGFGRLHESRETAASYPMWELGKKGLVEIEKGLISKKCYSYHLPNNYSKNILSPFGKIKTENIFV